MIDKRLLGNIDSGEYTAGVIGFANSEKEEPSIKNIMM